MSNGDSVGNQLEQTVTVEDSSMPSAEELKKYKDIDPKFIDYFITASEKEQEHRHCSDMKKLNIIICVERRTGRINFFGMLFAFLSIVVFMCVAGFALYLNHQWFAGIFGMTGLVTIVSIFVTKDDKRKK